MTCDKLDIRPCYPKGAGTAFFHTPLYRLLVGIGLFKW